MTSASVVRFIRFFSSIRLLFLFAITIGVGGCHAPESRPGSAREAAQGAETMRVLVWNVLHGANDVIDGPEKALAVIRESEADVVLMQESYDIDGDRPLLGAWLAEQLGWNQWQGKSPHLCILSRFDIAERFTHEPWHAIGARLIDDRGREFLAWSIWIDYRDNIARKLRDEPDISDADLLESEIVRSQRLAQAERIIARLEELGHLSVSVPLMVGGDWNTPSHLDWTLDASRVYLRRRPLDLPVSLAMTEAGFVDAYRVVHPNPVQRPGITWSPMFRMNGDKAQGFDRIDRLYLHDLDASRTSGVAENNHWRLEPVAGWVYPLVWEEETIPIPDRQFPSDHGAVLIELRIIEPKSPAVAKGSIPIQR